MSIQTSGNVFAFDTGTGTAAPRPEAAAQQPSGGAVRETALPDVVSGGNPLVAASNTLLNLIPQIRAMATNGDPGGFQQFLLENIRQFESRAGNTGVPMETIIGARYCICTAIDEAAAQTPWGGSGVWPKYSLLVALHNETWGGEKFFQLLSKLVQTPNQHIDLIELMYFCLMLGFEGRYHVVENGKSQLESLKSRLLQVIEGARGDRSGALSLHWRGVQRAAVPPWTLIPFWVAAALALLIAFLIFLWFNYRLASRSDDLFAAINGIRLPQAPAVIAAAPKPRLRQFLEPEIREGLVEVNDLADRSIIILRGDGLFDAGATVVKPRYVGVIERIAAALNEVSGKVVVNGYTDNSPIRTARFPSNWHLSQERAQAVTTMLTKSVSDGRRLHAEGRAESDPVAPNTTPEGKALNRRVEIVLHVAPQTRDSELQITPGANPRGGATNQK
ncbi:DotU family type VI secretion system protein [Acidovorax sp. NCPPB 3576]|uniref:DotU family type VI secretion system protein n=1 Tax=Acidovorax sp. NCPPB 3576 TaxID=2940488 RepID=UPI00234BA06F|nr:DotU family type VI secretion system protein [Acidovorax sp. NCPPB 3576]WCM90129.1 DotU family type VI secretion system protein [Acidovorax sp. NCPPB 3576]